MRLLPRKTGGEDRAPIYSFAAAIAATVCPTAGISRRGKQSAGYCAGADKLGNSAGNGFRLLQQHEVSGATQIDNPDALAELPAERVAIARWSRCIIEPLDHKTPPGRSGGGRETPPASIRPAPVFLDPTPATASARPAR